MLEKVVKTNIFHDSVRPFWRPKSWKKLFLTTFSTFPRISEEVFGIVKKVETVVFDNSFHHFYDSKDFLRNSWKKWKKLSQTTCSTIWASKTA